MHQDEIRNYLEIAVAFSTLLGLLYGFYVWVLPKLRTAKARCSDFIYSVERIPQALDAISSIKDIKAQVDTITKQVSPNGGSSMPDSMKRIEAKLADNANKAESIGKTVNLMAATMRATQNTNPRMATFEADAEGRLIDANKTYLRWAGRQLNEMLGWGWITTVHVDDREQVRREWVQAVADVRTSVMKYRIVDEDGEVIHVEVTATPIPEGVMPCEKWVGVMYLADGG
jgi:PAS domain S-box-containing protein